MEEDVKSLRDYLDILWRRKYWIVIPAFILMIGTVVFTYSLPESFKSQGLILIESQEIPQDLIRTTVTSYADQRIEVIKQRLLTTNRIMEVVEKHNLYLEQRKSSPITAPIVELFKSNVSVDIIQANVTDPASGRAKKASIAFTVSFMDQSPRKAQQVANELVTEFLNENARARTDRAQDTTQFLKLEGDRMQKEIQQTEKEIAEFRDQYSDSLPDMLEYNLNTVQNIQEEIASIQNQIMVQSDQMTTMGLQLSMIPKQLTGPTSNAAGQPSASMVALQQLRAEYRSMQSKYSANHPDLQRVKREIDALEAEIGVAASPREEVEMQLTSARSNLQTLKQRYAAEHPDVKAAAAEIDRLEQRLSDLPEEMSDEATTANGSTNPVYIEVSAKIDATEREIGRLRERQAELREKLAEYENRVYQTNQVQRAYQDLTRDRENKLAKYQELRAKQLEAELAQTLETENKGENFTLIEPPQVSNEAEKPNRKKLIAMGFVGSVGAGIGLAILVEMLFGGVRGYTQISRIVGKPPIVVIPIIQTDQQKRRKRRIIYSLIVLGIIFGLCAIALFHFFVMNLEVLWFKVLNKLSLL
ncbi:sugar transporter [Methylophaga nitratireducenticrescens]|uniref:Lipopolysaccharide biosynthesis protein n=1 Tax=Methylophaga nitratireducenticrescens TaxID=754476 RepID=I1XIL6_METNJ|nr:Wzz/FepE/Etk N-terminal domain-containing protein [Methylophaga nitratireducenticrescens]AFI84235.1 sugar transporter [Methylophaga nitratireducenticrescens]